VHHLFRKDQVVPHLLQYHKSGSGRMGKRAVEAMKAMDGRISMKNVLLGCIQQP
jgi:hypothetical protein